RLHRAGQPGRGAVRHHRVPHHLRGRTRAVRRHPAHEHREHARAAQVPGGIRMSPRGSAARPLGTAADFRPRAARRRALGLAFATACFAATVAGLIVLAILLVDLWRDGADMLSWDFIRSYPSRFASRAGIWPALVGSL